MAVIETEQLKKLFRLLDQPLRFQPIPQTSIHDSSVQCWLLREDLRHPVVSGNKWHKLYYHLLKAHRDRTEALASAGGVYSNHLHALAWLGQYLGIQTHGIIRGERPNPVTPTLKDVESWGMKLHFISRTHYRQLRSDPSMATKWIGNAYWIPEGGNDLLGLLGAMKFGRQLKSAAKGFDYLLLPCGTAITMSGLVLSFDQDTQILGIPVLKRAEYLNLEVKDKLAGRASWASAQWRLMTEFHFGGFGRSTVQLTRFENSLKSHLPFELDPVYTLKAFYALCHLLCNRFFKANSRVLFIHTGGLQGKRQAE